LQIHIIGFAFGLGVSSCSFLAISMEVKYFQELQHCIANVFASPKAIHFLSCQKA
jgi:hypothetical protein